jgi:methylmalonyl-CoA mutase, N-terminal domain
MTINATAIILLGAVRRRRPAAGRGSGPRLSGTVQNDILKEYVARGTYIYPPRPSLRIVTDIFAFCEREMPQWNTISISGYHIREAGSTAVQEVAFTFANAIAYVQAAVDAGLDVNRFGQRLSFFFNAHNDFLEEVAKFRAARRLWARMMRDRFGATTRARSSCASTRRRPAARSRRSSPTTTSSAWRCRRWRPCSAARSRFTPTAATRRWRCRPRSRRAGAAHAADHRARERAWRTRSTRSPARTTSSRSPTTSRQEARALLDRIDALGGTLSRHRGGLHPAPDPGRGLQGAAGRRQRRGVVVGVNRYVTDDAPAMDVFALDPAIESAAGGARQGAAAARDAGAGRRRSLPSSARPGARTTWCRHHRRRRSPGHRRRDRGYDARGVRRVPRSRARLTPTSSLMAVRRPAFSFREQEAVRRCAETR